MPPQPRTLFHRVRERYGWLAAIVSKPTSWFAKTAELVDLSTPAREPALDGLRGLAMLLVFLVHADRAFLALRGAESPWTLWFMNGVGHSGVELFFVLSGYLIYRLHSGESRPFLPFLRRRLERIYPVFLVVFGAYLLLSWARPEASKIPQGAHGVFYIAANLLLLPGVFDFHPMITVAWSLSYELFFYLTVPWSARGMRNWRPGARCAAIAGFAVVYTIYSVVDRHRYWQVGWLAFPPAAHMRVVLFTAGMLVFELSKLSRPGGFRVKWAGWAVVPVLVAAAPALYGMEEHPRRMAAWLPGFAAFPDVYRAWLLALCLPGVLYCALHTGNGFQRFFSKSLPRLLGNVSYSFYLIHGLSILAVRELVRVVVGPAAAGVGLYWMAVVLSAVASGLAALTLFALVEKPFSLAGYIRGRTGPTG